MGKLGQLLVARGWITVQQLTRALQNQNAVGGRLGTCLLEMDVLGEDLLGRSLSEQLGVPPALIEDLRGIPEEVLRLIPDRLVRRCRAIPFRLAGGRLDVAMQDPRNLASQDEVAFASGKRVKVHVLHEVRVFEALDKHYGEEPPSRYSLLLDRLNRARFLWEREQPAKPAAPAEQVLPALHLDDMLGAPRRFTPPPIPEPDVPSSPRVPVFTGARGERGEPAGAAGRGPGQGAQPATLPPLAEVDLRVQARRSRSSRREPARPQQLPTAGAAAQVTLSVAAPAAPTGEPSTPTAPRSAATETPSALDDTLSAPGAAPYRPASTAPTPSAAGAPLQGPATELAPDLVPNLASPQPRDTPITLIAPLSQLLPPTAPSQAAAESAHQERQASQSAAPGRALALTPEERADLGMSPESAAAAATAAAAAAAAVTSSVGTAGAALRRSGPLPVREAPATFAELDAAFATTSDREEVGRLLLGFLSHVNRRVALFQTNRDKVTGWMAQGDGIDQEAFARYSASFAQPSVFLNLREGSGLYLGPLPPMPAHRELALAWGGGLPRDCLVLPVRLKDRLVAVIYTDGPDGGLGGIDLELMRRLVAATAAAFERCILTRKRGGT